MYNYSDEYEASNNLPYKSLSSYGLRNKILGEGAYGSVYLYNRPKDNKSFAVKFFKKNALIASLKEISILIRCDHPNIVQLYDVTSYGEMGTIVMEYLEFNLEEMIKMNPYISYRETINIITQITEALAYLHSKDIAHKDLKEQNIMISNDRMIKLIDFGFSRYDLCSENSQYNSNLGSPIYTAPEILARSTKQSIRSDIWSLGVIIYNLISGNLLINKFYLIFHPEEYLSIDLMTKRLFQTFGPVDSSLYYIDEYRKYSNITAIADYKNQMFDIIKPEYKKLIPFIDQIFNLNPIKRPTASQILQMPIFSPFIKQQVNTNKSCYHSLKIRESYPTKHSIGNLAHIARVYTRFLFYTIASGYDVVIFQLTCWICDSVFLQKPRTNSNDIRSIINAGYYIANVVIEDTDFIKFPFRDLNISDEQFNNYVNTIINAIHYDIQQTTSISYSSNKSPLYTFFSGAIYISELKYKYLAADLNSIVESFYYKFNRVSITLNEDEIVFLEFLYSISNDLIDIEIDLNVSKIIKEMYRTHISM